MIRRGLQCLIQSRPALNSAIRELHKSGTAINPC